MAYPIVGMTAALWLILATLLGIETGFRAGLSVAAGIVSFVLAFASSWRFAGGIGIAVVGIFLGLTNLFVPGSTGAMASYAFSAAALAVSGMAPHPKSTRATVATGEPSVNTPLSRQPPSLAA